MVEALDTEKELLNSLSKRRTALRDSFRLKSFTDGGKEEQDGNAAVTTTSLALHLTDGPLAHSLVPPQGSETTDSLLADLRGRRLKRKALVKPDDESPDLLSVTPSLPPLSSHEQDGIPGPSGGVSGIRRLKDIRDKIRKTRFDTTAPSQDQRPLPSLTSTAPPGIIGQESSLRWKVLSAQIGEHKTKTQSLEFFTGSIDQEEIIEETDTRTEPDGEEDLGREREEEIEGREEDEGQEEGDISALLEQQVPDLKATHLQTNLTDVDIGVCKYGFPQYTPYRQRVSQELQVYFTPSSNQVPPEYKTPSNAPPVYREESGLYVGHRPKVKPGNQAIMENRLLKRPDEGKGWFGEDGLLIVQPDPMTVLNTRPLIVAYDENRHLKYQQPEITTKNQYLIRNNEDDGSYQLEFFIGHLQFKHHPLYSVEHVLGSILHDQYQQYKAIDRTRLADHHRHKIQALYYTIHNLNQSISEVESNGTRTDMEDIQIQLKHYQQEVRVIRQQLKQVESKNYQLIRNILETWRNIKRLRDEQGYSCTNVQLIVQRITSDPVMDEAQWQRDIEMELSELREDFDVSNAQELLTYESQLSEWKDYERSRRRALRQSRRDSSQSHTPSITEGSQSSLDPTTQDTVSLSSIPPERPRPEAPPTFNEDQTRSELLDYYRQHYRKPGEPIIIPLLSNNYPVTQQCPREEEMRRDAVTGTRYKLRVFYNDNEICSTKDSSLNSDFSVNINEHFTVKVVEWPHIIKIQIVDSSSLIPSNLCDIYIPIPDNSITSSSAHTDSYQFSSNQNVGHHHTAVGSGQPSPVLPNLGTLHTSGNVEVMVCWGETEDGKVLCPSGILNRGRPKTNTIPHLGVGGVNDVQNIKRWIEEAHLDPNDPRNFELLQLAESIPSSKEDTTYFRLLSIDDSARFVSDQEFTNNRRFNLIQLREQGHPALKGKSIPMNEESITESLWKSVQDYKPYSVAELPVSVFGNFYEGRKEERMKYLMDVRERVLGRTGTRPQDKLTLEDVIHEDLIPNISTLKNTILEFFSPRQPLKPKRKPRHKPKPQNVHVTQCHVTIRVVRAVNVPLRGEGFGDIGRLRMEQRFGGTIDNREEEIVKPYVEVTFGRERDRTGSGQGPHPHWNEEIVLPFHPPENDFSPANLQKVTDELRFDLYDEITLDILNDERQRGTDVHQRTEKKWLGSLAIPFSTLHARSRIEGTFQLNKPPVLLGYHLPPPLSSTSSSSPVDSHNVYIQLFISIEPTLSALPPISEKFDSAEDSQLLERASQWLKTIRERFPSRNYMTTALDISGKNVFITRFIHSQNPPVELLPVDYEQLRGDELLHCMECLAWFVSLVPSLPDAILFSGTCDIWTTSDQFLHMLGGDEEEHAVLLCNYFLNLGQLAWVMLGHAIPEGPTAYVLTVHPSIADEYILWNPSTGRHFINTQAHIPFTSVGTIFNDSNIWGNVQEWDDPGQVIFDLRNTKHWSPLFATSMEPLTSVQQDVLTYSEPNSQQIQHLQIRIDQLVHNHIEELRVRHLTRWNRYCSRILQNVLPRFEERPFTSPDMASEHRQELKDSFPGYQIHGFPLNLRCSDTIKLLEAVERTGLHLCEHDRVEFSLGVYIHSYPNDVLSVWIYITTLIPF